MYMYVPRRGLHVLMKSNIGSVHPVSGCQADELTCFVNMAVGMKGFMADRNVWRGDYYFHLRKKPLCECVCSMKLLRLRVWGVSDDNDEFRYPEKSEGYVWEVDCTCGSQWAGGVVAD